MSFLKSTRKISLHLILIENVEHLPLVLVGARVDDALVIAEKGAANLAEVDKVEQSVAETTSGLVHMLDIIQRAGGAAKGVEEGRRHTRPCRRRRSRHPCPRTARPVLRFADPSSTGTAALSVSRQDNAEFVYWARETHTPPFMYGHVSLFIAHCACVGQKSSKK
jgi:hypothetical protein